MKLAVVIVNWNSGSLIVECIRSLLSSSFSDFLCYVVDNNSSDGSFMRLRIIFDDTRLVYIQNNENSGFGKACNQALSLVNAEYVLFLNPDTALDKSTLENAIRFIEQKPDIHVLGIQNIRKDNTILATCSRFPHTGRLINDMLGLSKIMPHVFKPGMIMKDWDHNDSRFVDHVSGAFYLVRFRTLSLTGFFDERFFLYLEDLDLSKRITDYGGKIFFNADYKVFHAGGGTSEKIPAKRLFYSLQSRVLFCEKYRKELNPTLVLFFSLIPEPLIRLIGSVIRLRWKDCAAIIQSYKLFYSWLIKRRDKN